jgi:hypothetical protein
MRSKIIKKLILTSEQLARLKANLVIHSATHSGG